MKLGNGSCLTDRLDDDAYIDTLPVFRTPKTCSELRESLND